MKAVVLALVAFACVGARPVDWTKTVTRGANGAYVLGNPRAKVRLVEYLSYSCSHCADYTAQSSTPLKSDYVARGRVAVEFRNAVRDRFDFAAALLARCGGPAKFFAQNETLFAAQETLLAKAQTFEASNTLREDAPINVALTGMAQGSGMTALMAARGIPGAAANACLTNKAEQDVVLAMTKEAWEIRKLQGTPSFLVNGKDIGPSRWADVEKKLKVALVAR